MDSVWIYTHNLRSFISTMSNKLRNCILVLTLLLTGLFLWLWPNRQEIISQIPDFDYENFDEYDTYVYDEEDYGFYYDSNYGKSLDLWKRDVALAGTNFANASLVCFPETGYTCDENGCVDHTLKEYMVVENFPIEFNESTSLYFCEGEDCSEESYVYVDYYDYQYLEWGNSSVSVDMDLMSYNEMITTDDYSQTTYYYGQCYTPTELSEQEQQETI